MASSTSHLGLPLTVLRRLAARAPVLRPPVRWAERALQRYTDWRTAAFDRRYGTETFERVELNHLEVGAHLKGSYETWMYGPINPQFFDEMMKGISVPWAETTFVDIGAGKGLALMLASRYGFKRLWGIEFSRALVDAGERNVARYAQHVKHPVKVDWTCDDFLQVDLPNEPSLYFLNNPFPHAIAEKVIRALEKSLAEHPRPAWVLYRKALRQTADQLDASPQLEKVKVTPFWRFYRSRYLRG